MEKIHVSGKDSEFEKHILWGLCCCLQDPQTHGVNCCFLASCNTLSCSSPQTRFVPVCLSWTQELPLNHRPWQCGCSCHLSPQTCVMFCSWFSFLVTFSACNTASLSRLSTFWGIGQLLYYMRKFISRSITCFCDCKDLTACYQVAAKLICKTAFKLLVVMKGSGVTEDKIPSLWSGFASLNSYSPFHSKIKTYFYFPLSFTRHFLIILKLWLHLTASDSVRTSTKTKKKIYIYI